MKPTQPDRGHPQFPAYRRPVAFIAFLLMACPALLGQQEPTISVKVNVVNTLATVRDKHGQIIPNLTRDDFTLEEDGRPQAIRYFSRETDLPLTLGLLVDTSLSQRFVLEQERTASYTFLDEMLRQEMDQAFVIHFDYDIELLQDLTASRRKLGDALGLLQIPRGGSGGSTTLYDAVYLGSNDLMKKQEGRKALIILSDGVDTRSKIGLAEAIESAQRSDTVVYSILFYDEFAYSGAGRLGGGWDWTGQTGKKVLEKLSRETGGRMFEVSKKESIDKVYSQIEDELRSQYSIGYSPEKDAHPGYRKIRIVTKQKGLIVQARTGYYAGGE
jgi:VWFA-related protein